MTADLVLLGAGHAHVEVLRAFARRPVSGLRLTLLTRAPRTPYSGMLPGWIAGHYGTREIEIDCARLATAAGATLLLDESTGLDLPQRRILRRTGPPLPFDLLSLNIGASPNTISVPGADAHAIPVKPITDFLPRFEAMLARARATPSRIAVIGGGAGGLELALALHWRLRNERTPSPLTLITGRTGLLPGLPPCLRRRFRALCTARGIALIEGARVTAVEPGILHLEPGTTLPADEILWVTEAAPPLWLAASGLACDPAGFALTGPTLASLNHADIFAAGDCAAFAPRPLPKSGVYAVREGRILAANLRRRLHSRPLRPYRPQRDALYLITTGDKSAFGTRNGLALSSRWAWTWKNWLDRRFIARFHPPCGN